MANTATINQTTAAPRWRLYSSAHVAVSSAQSSWADALKDNVLAVVWQHQDAKSPTVELGSPYYFHGGTWLARVWDPTLYLRQLGTVKFGRWTDDTTFKAAWRAAVTSVCAPNDIPNDLEENNGGKIIHSGAFDAVPPRPAWWLYYDNGSIYSANEHTWAEIPSDGALAACYRVVVDEIALTIAKRRFTYYYWDGRELANTDDLDAVLAAHPQFKRGRVTFEGLKAVRPMADELAAALKDTLEDVPWGA